MTDTEELDGLTVPNPQSSHLISRAHHETGRPLSLLGHITGAHVVWALLLTTTIPWRRDVLYEGGADSVVLAKAAISLVALALAIHLAGHAERKLPLPAAPVLMFFMYLSATVLGGYVNGTVAPAAVVAIRVAVLAVAVLFLLTRYPARTAMRYLVHVLALVVTVASISGFTAFHGRLGGGLPPLKPNALAFLASVCAVWLLAKALAAQETNAEIVLLAASLGVVLLTGSRTSLAALFSAAIVMGLRATALRVVTFVTLAFLAPILAAIAIETDLLTAVFLRGGERSLATLSNRTIAWDAALLSDRDPWENWFGQGLTQKTISVPGQWWTEQLLDSSLISALVQGGLVGFVLVLLLTFSTAVRAGFAPRDEGALWIGLIVLTGGRALLESGLFDATTALLVFLVSAIGCRTLAPRSARVSLPDKRSP
jgi:O-antigen ligase